MPPQRTRNIPDDLRSEASSTREKYAGLFATTVASKGRRHGTATGRAASNLKEVTNVNQSTNGQHDASEEPQKVALCSSKCTEVKSPLLTDRQINWSSFDASVLLAYRNLHHLDVPPSFINPYNERMLTQPGIGQFSPTMARHKARQRVSKDRLAMTVRKDFNDAAVHENETITSFIYSVHNQGEFGRPFDSGP